MIVNSYWYLAIAVVSCVVCRTLLLILAQRHAYAHEQAQEELDANGVKRVRWSLSTGHDNTLVGRTLGRWYLQVAERSFRRRQRLRERAAMGALAVAVAAGISYGVSGSGIAAFTISVACVGLAMAFGLFDPK